MVDQGTGPDEAALAIAARHALHDEEIVAASATGSLDPIDDAGEIERARSLIERCAACRDLHADIAAIGAAFRSDALGTVTAPRDFRLTVEDARRLGRPASARGILAGLRRSMANLARPAGASLATLGVVGLLVGSITLGGGTASAPRSVGAGATSASGAPAEMQGSDNEPDTPKSSDRTAVLGPGSSGPAPQVDGGSPPAYDVVSADQRPVAWLLAGSAVLLGAGLVLLAIAFRRGRDSRSSS